MSKLFVALFLLACLGAHALAYSAELDSSSSSTSTSSSPKDNITAVFECKTDECNSGCVHASLEQDVCTWVEVAVSYIRYSCINDGSEVQLLVYGPLESLCTDRSSLHVRATFPTDQCVLPNKLGGYTIYHCPKSVE